MYEYELVNACLKMLRDMFNMQPGESIAITCDTETNMEVVEATAQAAVILGAKPFVIKIAAPRGCGKIGDPDMPIEALVNGIKSCDAWVEYNYQWIYYSTAYDRIVEDVNNRPRYLCMVGATPDLIIRNIGKVDQVALREFILKMDACSSSGKHFHVTTPAGTDIQFDNQPGREFYTADGLIGKGEVKMMPGQIAWAPNWDSINGTIVIDGTLTPPLGKVNNPITLSIKKGFITKIEGTGSDASEFEAWLKGLDDPNMYLCAHISYGFNPGAKLTGDIVEDERVWGCTEWGFGNVGPQMASDIPGGIPAASHSDGICLNSSVWLDGVQILDKGTVVGPTSEIVELAKKLGK